MLIALTLLLPAINLNLTQAQGGEGQSTWTSMKPMSTERGGFGLAVVNGKIYAIGGLNRNNFPLSTTEMYNPQTNEWTAKAPMPTPRSGFAVTVYLDRIYVIGGTVGNGFVGNNEVYDPVSNTWETKTSMPTPRADLSATVVNDKIYLIGGKKYSSTPPYYNETNINEVYDPVGDSWSTKMPVPTPVQGYASAVQNDKIYLMGGSLEPKILENTFITSANQVYDTQNDTWSVAAKLTNIVSYGAAAATEGFMAPARIYCIGGYSNGEYSGQVQSYNSENNSWSIVDPMPTPRAYLGVVVISDVLFAIGGFDGTNWLDVNEQYKPVGYGTIPPRVQIISPENKTYSEVSLAFTTNRDTQWMGYSLDNKANVTVKSETQLSNLTEGAHRVTIYANDTLGNMGSSNVVFFSVDTFPPNIMILLPQNQSYEATEIQLTFYVNENVTFLAYSLDGQENVEIIGNITLPALSDGGHSLTLYATDALGNSAQKAISFNIAPFPVVIVVALVAITTIILASGYLLVNRRKPSNDKKIASGGP